jgi:iron complex transport system substrate-binding protein
MWQRWGGAGGLLLLLAALASSCGGAGAASSRAESAAAVTIRAANGTVVLTGPPRRIISLSASATEDLFAVGAGPQVVAVDSYSTYPAAAPRTKLSGFDPNIEAIASYRPDLVVIDSDANKIVEHLATLSIPVLVEPAPDNLSGAYDQIIQLGRATGHPARAAKVVAAMRRRIATTLASVGKPTKPLSVYNELDQRYFSVTSNTFIGQLFRLLGLRNIADQAHASGAYPQLSAEYIVASRPDLIVLADTKCCGQNAKTVARRAGWTSIPAVHDHHVVGVDDSIASEWGPRVTVFFAKLANAVRQIEGDGA